MDSQNLYIILRHKAPAYKVKYVKVFNNIDEVEKIEHSTTSAINVRPFRISLWVAALNGVCNIPLMVISILWWWFTIHSIGNAVRCD